MPPKASSALWSEWITFSCTVFRPPFALTLAALTWLIVFHRSDWPTAEYCLGCLITIWVIVEAGVPFAVNLGKIRQGEEFSNGAKLVGELAIAVLAALLAIALRRSGSSTLFPYFRPDVAWVLFAASVVSTLFGISWLKGKLKLHWLVCLAVIGWAISSELRHNWLPPLKVLTADRVRCATRADFERIAPFTTALGPRYWYKRQGGKVQLFNGSGADLKPIDQGAIDELERQVGEDESRRNVKLTQLRNAERELFDLTSRNDASDFATLAPFAWPKFRSEWELSQNKLREAESTTDMDALTKAHEESLRGFAEARKLFLRAVEERKASIDLRELNQHRQSAVAEASDMRQRLSDEARSVGVDEHSAGTLPSWSHFLDDSRTFDQEVAALAGAHDSGEIDHRIEFLHSLSRDLSALIDRIKGELVTAGHRETALREAASMRDQLSEQAGPKGADGESAGTASTWARFAKTLRAFDHEVAALRGANDVGEIDRRSESLRSLFEELSSLGKTLRGEIAKAKERQTIDGLIQKYVGETHWKQARANRRVGVLVVAADHVDDALTGSLVDQLNKMGVDASGALLTPAFVTDGQFSKVFSGNPSRLPDLKLGDQCEYLLLASHTLTAAARSPDVPDRFVVDRQLDIRVVSASSGKRVNGSSFNGHGAGFSADEAESGADADLRQAAPAGLAVVLHPKE
jgi:hypothetical protein